MGAEMTTDVACDRPTAITRSLLGYGVLAGVLYLVSGLVQAFTREGYQIERHDLSLLANGPLGWVQILTFLLAGLMTIAAAVGMARAERVLGGSVWGPRLVGGYGAGVALAGVFVADPMNGFPLGTPDGPPVAPTWHGFGHVVVGGLGFLALVAGCLVMARRFASSGQRGWAAYSAATGVLFLVAFAGIASGSSAPAVVLGFWVGVVLAWAWVAAVSVHLYRAVL
jgi:hypothetical protein